MGLHFRGDWLASTASPAATTAATRSPWTPARSGRSATTRCSRPAPPSRRCCWRCCTGDEPPRSAATRDSMMSLCTLPADARVADFLRNWAEGLAERGLRTDQITLRMTRCRDRQLPGHDAGDGEPRAVAPGAHRRDPASPRRDRREIQIPKGRGAQALHPGLRGARRFPPSRRRCTDHFSSSRRQIAAPSRGRARRGCRAYAAGPRQAAIQRAGVAAHQQHRQTRQSRAREFSQLGAACANRAMSVINRSGRLGPQLVARPARRWRASTVQPARRGSVAPRCAPRHRLPPAARANPAAVPPVSRLRLDAGDLRLAGQEQRDRRALARAAVQRDPYGLLGEAVHRGQAEAGAAAGLPWW